VSRTWFPSVSLLSTHLPLPSSLFRHRECKNTWNTILSRALTRLLETVSANPANRTQILLLLWLLVPSMSEPAGRGPDKRTPHLPFDSITWCKKEWHASLTQRWHLFASCQFCRITYCLVK
jgi:hypothetical protein